ncbi:MAG TPA: protein-glutamate O-methyltransferase CheR [Sphingobium sp.]|nr:protein-glutamate O-methyltransferase CheR [Sphingobium sp.]
MSDAVPETLLSGPALGQLTALLYRLTGMKFAQNKRYYLERRVAQRMKRTAVTDIGRYLMLLDRDPHERQLLINAITINETYFFREDHQLSALVDHILPAIAATKRPGDLIRIWSLPCSTGEEAYSIALWLLEKWPLVDAYNVEIVGSDIDTHALDAAREGLFGTRSLARLPADLIATYFEPAPHHHRRIVQDLRESVLFTQVNLNDAASVASQGRFDIILCRNLLIYFDDASRIEAARHLHEALTPGGYLLLGHSESMARIDERFALLRLDTAIVYRRR